MPNFLADLYKNCTMNMVDRKIVLGQQLYLKGKASCLMNLNYMGNVWHETKKQLRKLYVITACHCASVVTLYIYL